MRQVVKKGLSGRDDVFKAKHNFLRRRSTLSETLYGGEGRQYKASIRLDAFEVGI